jgi:hypothetical protein
MQSKEIGLKKEIKRQVGFKNYEAKVGDYNKLCMIRAWKAMEAAGLDDAVSDMIWDYVSNPMGHTYKHLASDLLGYKTVIKDYVSKKTGKVSLAHYTVHGSYLGSAKDMGDESVSYEGYFLINKNDFVLELDKLATLSDEIVTGSIAVQISVDDMIRELFAPKPMAAVPRMVGRIVTDSDAESDDEDVPIGQLKRK